MGWEYRTYEESYEVANPEWQRLDDVLACAEGYAPFLRESVDRPLRVMPDAWQGGMAGEVYEHLLDMKRKAVSAADQVVDAIREARDAQASTLVKTRVTGRYVLVAETRW